MANLSIFPFKIISGMGNSSLFKATTSPARLCIGFQSKWPSVRNLHVHMSLCGFPLGSLKHIQQTQGFKLFSLCIVSETGCSLSVW